MNIDIIVPVFGRPEHAKTFTRSLDASYDVTSHRIRVFPVVENVVDEQAWDEPGNNLLFTGLHTFPEKVNEGYEFTDAEWVLLVGSDIRFHQGWVDQLEIAWAHDPGCGVMGTKDLGNQRTMDGVHTCHPVIRRSYIDQLGASWDGPGTVCHEYKHCFVDDEIVTKAKQNGVWRPTNAVIEHLHPYWGKAKHDEVYEEGESWFEMDRETFIQRVLKYAPERVGPDGRLI